MDPITIALVAAAGLAVLGGGGKRRVYSGYARDPAWEAVTHKHKWRQDSADYLGQLARYISYRWGMMPELDKFLTAVAKKESTFNPNASAGSSSNSARGLYGLRPDSAFGGELKPYAGKPNRLLDPRFATLAAVDYIFRAVRTARNKGVEPDWLAMRRWWAYPHLVTDVDEYKDHSPVVRERFSKMLTDVHLSPDFMYHRVAMDNYPGTIVIGKDLGVL